VRFLRETEVTPHPMFSFSLPDSINMSDTLLPSSDASQVSKICKTYSISTQQFNTLQSRSVSAKATAYCPYSQFRVGATLLTHDDKYIDGANVENASYPVGTCAERVAFGKAITEGHRGFKAVAVATDISPPASPCGMCRQLLVLSADFVQIVNWVWRSRAHYRMRRLILVVDSIREFCELDTPIIMFDKDGAFAVATLKEVRRSSCIGVGE
jgi:cytidine deaminase